MNKDIFVQTKCKGETYKEAENRNNYFFENGKKEERKRMKNILKEGKRKWIEYVDLSDSPFKTKWKIIFNDLFRQLEKEIKQNG